MNRVFLESGYVSFNKHGEELCGDRVVTVNNEDFETIVLSDGLGSGVKANILSTLTAKIIGPLFRKQKISNQIKAHSTNSKPNRRHNQSNPGT